MVHTEEKPCERGIRCCFQTKQNWDVTLTNRSRQADLDEVRQLGLVDLGPRTVFEFDRRVRGAFTIELTHLLPHVRGLATENHAFSLSATVSEDFRHARSTHCLGHHD